MSASAASKTGSSAFSAGTGMPDWAMSASKPTVLSATVLRHEVPEHAVGRVADRDPSSAPQPRLPTARALGHLGHCLLRAGDVVARLVDVLAAPCRGEHRGHRAPGSLRDVDEREEGAIGTRALQMMCLLGPRGAARPTPGLLDAVEQLHDALQPLIGVADQRLDLG